MHGTWPKTKHIQYTRTTMESVQLPVIDLQQCDQELENLRQVSERWGGFRLINHGVPAELMAEMKDLARELLELPVELKKKNEHVITGSGYIPPDPVNKRLLEALGLFDAGNPVAVSSFCNQLQVSPRQRETLEKYAEAMHSLAIEIASKIAKSMGIEDPSFEKWPSHLRTNKMDFTKDTLGLTGVHLHSDPGFVTLLQEDENIGGLEFMNPSGELIPVETQPGTFVVNLGDSATIWSNGLLRSLEHRVQCKSTGSRISIPIFLSPPASQVMETRAEFIDANHPRLYAPFTYDDFRNTRYANRVVTSAALKFILVKDAKEVCNGRAHEVEKWLQK